MPISIGSERTSGGGAIEVGTIVSCAMPSATPLTGYLLCNGGAASRTTYSGLFNVIVPNKGSVTITVAAPAVVTLNGHGFLTGESVYLTSSGALPTGLTANTLYYVVVNNANSFWLASSYANAIANNRLPTTAVGSGTHTLFSCPYGLGDGSTTFNVPDVQGLFLRGAGVSTFGVGLGDVTIPLGLKLNDATQGHRHASVGGGYGPASFILQGGVSYYGWDGAQTISSPIADAIGNGTPRTAIETRVKSVAVNYFIKF